MITLRNYQKNLVFASRGAFNQGYHRPLICAPCGSGKTCVFSFMADQAQSKGLHVVIIVHRTELYSQTVETFKRYQIELKTIRVVMAVTYSNHIETEEKPDLIITDEAHLSMAATWQKIYNKFPDVKVVAFTATPCRLDGKPLGTTYDNLIVGISTRELIEQGYLSDYKYFAPSVADLSNLKRKGADFDPESSAELLMQRAVYGDVIESYRKYADGLQTICYCSSIKHSESMAEEFRAAGINAVHFDGNTPTGERKQIVRDFRDKKIQILCNVDLISVGFDVPDCWCCILLRPTMSTALAIQQSGRALRPQPGKVAIILDHVGNYTRHGLPDDPHEWSLDSSIKPQEQYREDGLLTVRQCPECFFTFKSGPSVCPNCGAEIQKTRQEIKNIKKIHLEEIKHERQEKAADTVKKIDSVQDCNNLSEIMAFAKMKGYKPGWGYFQAKQRGILR